MIGSQPADKLRQATSLIDDLERSGGIAVAISGNFFAESAFMFQDDLKLLSRDNNLPFQQQIPLSIGNGYS